MNVRAFVVSCAVTSFVALGAAGAAAQYTPTRLKSGEAPEPPPNTVGWAWDIADAIVDSSGRSRKWRGVYVTPANWGGFVWKAVTNTWSFEPARDGGVPVEGHVLVVACYRPASLTTGPDSRAPVGFGSPSPDVPSATVMIPPAYPVRALGDGVVIVELQIDATGAVTDARVVRSAAGFDEAALEAAQQWRFQPARREGVAVPAYAYLIFGFRQPVIQEERAPGLGLWALGSRMPWQGP